MHFVRGSKVSLFFVALALLFPSRAHAIDVPVLTWENGKSQSVVLGGETADLSWKLFLDGEGISPIPFGKSRASSAGFFVFTIALSRDLPTGAYTVVSKGPEGKTTLLAGVEVVERINYDILEIPLDLYFVLFLFIAFLLLVVSTRTWRRKFPLEDEDVTSSSPHVSALKRGSDALLVQRWRWQRRWLGRDDYLVGESLPSSSYLSLAPTLALVTTLYSALQDFFFPLQDLSSALVLAFLAALTFWDRYSGKLVLLAYLTIFILFNPALNAPTILALILLLSFFLIPRYVGDVTYWFSAHLGSGGWRTRYVAILSSTMAVGLSVFWLYLLSESTIQSSETQASRVTPVAIVLASSQFLRAMRINMVEVRRSSDRETSDGLEAPIMTLMTLAISSLIACGVIVAWTGDFLSSVFLTALLSCSLLTIHLRLSTQSKAVSRLLGSTSPLLPIVIVLALSLGLIFWISRLPQVVADRSHWILMLAVIPPAILALLKLFAVVAKENEPS